VPSSAACASFRASFFLSTLACAAARSVASAPAARSARASCALNSATSAFLMFNCASASASSSPACASASAFCASLTASFAFATAASAARSDNSRSACTRARSACASVSSLCSVASSSVCSTFAFPCATRSCSSLMRRSFQAIAYWRSRSLLASESCCAACNSSSASLWSFCADVTALCRSVRSVSSRSARSAWAWARLCSACATFKSAWAISNSVAGTCRSASFSSAACRSLCAWSTSC